MAPAIASWITVRRLRRDSQIATIGTTNAVADEDEHGAVEQLQSFLCRLQPTLAVDRDLAELIAEIATRARSRGADRRVGDRLRRDVGEVDLPSEDLRRRAR